MINTDFWKGKKVFVTGHTGFKGSWLSLWLLKMGAEVIGYALEPKTSRDNFVLCGLSERMIDIRGDIRDLGKLKDTVKEFEPEVVFHLAAQPLVRLSYQEPELTYSTNVMGTLNVLECIRNSTTLKTGIMVTTDKCYENKEQIWGYRETDHFGGHDPYSSSKGCAEILISSYRKSYFDPKEFQRHGKAVASVRAGNVIGGGDWSEDRIIPDCIRSLERNEEIKIRNPKAIRPWQHVLDPLAGYLMLAEKLQKEPQTYSGGWNFGPESHSFATVWDVARELVRMAGRGSLLDCSLTEQLHEAQLLYLDITKAKTLLNWVPKWELKKSVEMTAKWYMNFEIESVYQICLEQIDEYVSGDRT